MASPCSLQRSLVFVHLPIPVRCIVLPIVSASVVQTLDTLIYNTVLAICCATCSAFPAYVVPWLHPHISIEHDPQVPHHLGNLDSILFLLRPHITDYPIFLHDHCLSRLVASSCHFSSAFQAPSQLSVASQSCPPRLQQDHLIKITPTSIGTPKPPSW